MSKRRWLIGSVVATVMVLGIMGGMVMAQETPGDADKSSFAARVAEILGLDEATVQDAIDQAKAEMRDEALQSKLDRLVESGRMTQEQADEYKTWLESKPEGVPSRMFGGFGKRHRSGHHGRSRWGNWKASPGTEGSS